MAVTTTATTNFGSTVTALIKAEIIALLRVGLPHIPRELTVFASYQKGTDGTFRFTTIGDLAPNTTPLVEGVTPTGQSLGIKFDQFTADQYGDVVRSSDEFADRSPADIATIMVERVKRAAAVSMDELARAVWNSKPAGETKLGTGTVAFDPTKIEDAYAILSARGVEKVNGAYIGIAHPFVVADLKHDVLWIDTQKYAASTALLTNEVGMWRGIRFIESPKATVEGTVYRTIIAGAQALAWADPALLSTHYVGFVDSDSDPLAQRSSAGWKGFAGGVLVGTGAQSDGKPRYLVIESTAALNGFAV